MASLTGFPTMTPAIIIKLNVTNANNHGALLNSPFPFEGNEAND